MVVKSGRGVGREREEIWTDQEYTVCQKVDQKTKKTKNKHCSNCKSGKECNKDDNI